MTESDLVRLVKKILKEQGMDAFEEHMIRIQDIYDQYNEDITEEELEYLIDEIEYEIQSAQEDDELNEEELEELIRVSRDVSDDMIEMFYEK